MTSLGVSVMSTEEKMERLANKYLKLRGQYDTLERNYADSQREKRELLKQLSSKTNGTEYSSGNAGSTSPSEVVDESEEASITHYKERIRELEDKLRSLGEKNNQPKPSPTTSVLGFGAMKGLLGPTGALGMGNGRDHQDAQDRMKELEATVEELQTRVEVVNDDCKRLQDELASVSRERDDLLARTDGLAREREKEAALLRDLRTSSESASRRICALQEEKEKLGKELLAAEG
ncbi:hypothetical protein FOZ63_033756, partial [Perkinsus olseni]